MNEYYTYKFNELPFAPKVVFIRIAQNIPTKKKIEEIFWL